MLGIFMLVEAINSVAIEHPAGCRCLTCRAAGGDRIALAQVIAHMDGVELPGELFLKHPGRL